MNVDRQVYGLGGGEDRVEPGVVEEEPFECSGDQRADEPQIADTATQFLGRRGGVVKRKRGETPEPVWVCSEICCARSLLTRRHKSTDSGAPNVLGLPLP